MRTLYPTPNQFAAILILVHCGGIPGYRCLFCRPLSKTGIPYLIFFEHPSLSTPCIKRFSASPVVRFSESGSSGLRMSYAGGWMGTLVLYVFEQLVAQPICRRHNPSNGYQLSQLLSTNRSHRVAAQAGECRSIAHVHPLVSPIARSFCSL